MIEGLVQGILRDSVVDVTQIHGWIVIIDGKLFKPTKKPFIFESRKAAVQAFYNEFAWKARIYYANYLNTGEINGIYSYAENSIGPWDSRCSYAYRDLKSTLGDRLQFKRI